MTRTDILNAIAKTIGARRYVEIGVRNPADNFDLIQVTDKVGVDPRPARGDILAMTSDAYFAARPEPADLYFIDGLHDELQAYADFVHAGVSLWPRGVIVMHDCLPRSLAAMAPEKPAGGGAWNGTVWRAWQSAAHCPGWDSMLVADDHGCGVIWRGVRQRGAPFRAVSEQDFLAMGDHLKDVNPLAAVLAALEARQ